MKTLDIGVTIAIMALCLLACQTDACTAITIKAKSGLVNVAQALEFTVDLVSNIIFVTRGT